MAKKKKGPSKAALAKVWQLNAFECMYKSACDLAEVDPYKPLLSAITQCQTDAKALDKVCFQGPEIGGQTVSLICNCLGGYDGVKNLCFWGCDIGDVGLDAVSKLLTASVDRWYKGSRPMLVEIHSDGADLGGEAWKARSREMVLGDTGMPTFGLGMQMPSLVMGDTEAVVPEGGYFEGPIEESTPGLAEAVEPLQEASVSGSYHAALQALGVQRRPAACNFSIEALQRMSLALSVRGLSLKVLSLDHNRLGDEALHVLHRGLKGCQTLKQLSLSYCDIGPAGATAIADTMILHHQQIVATFQPQYEIINLQGNPLGPQGLVAMAKGIAKCATLKSMILADIGVADQDDAAVGALAGAISTSLTIEALDFGFNQISDSAAAAFLPAIQNSNKRIKGLRLTHRLGRDLAAAIYAAVKENLKSGKKKKGGKKKKRK